MIRLVSVKNPSSNSIQVMHHLINQMTRPAAAEIDALAEELLPYPAAVATELVKLSPYAVAAAADVDEELPPYPAAVTADSEQLE